MEETSKRNRYMNLDLIGQSHGCNAQYVSIKVSCRCFASQSLCRGQYRRLSSETSLTPWKRRQVGFGSKGVTDQQQAPLGQATIPGESPGLGCLMWKDPKRQLTVKNQHWKDTRSEAYDELPCKVYGKLYVRSWRSHRDTFHWLWTAVSMPRHFGCCHLVFLQPDLTREV